MSLLGRGRVDFPVRDMRLFAGVWRAGELAVCVADRWLPHAYIAAAPRMGEVLRVTAVHEGIVRGHLLVLLAFEGKRVDVAYDARAFRKAVADDRPAEAAFTASLKSGERRPAAPLPAPSPAEAPACVAPQGTEETCHD